MSYAPKYDGDFSTAQEIEPSPIVSTDEVTRSLIVQRTFGVGVSNYVPLPQGSLDPLYPNTYLINETNASIQGPVKFFNRNYAEVPASWEEPRNIAFALPGKAAAVISSISSLPIGWNPYGVSAPYTKPLVANVQHSYAFVTPGFDPRASFTIPALTQLSYDGVPVDYTGDVYVSIGQATVVQGGGLPDIIENRFQFDGTVTGWTDGQDWVVSVDIKRWRGPIWEMEVVTLETLMR